MPRLLNPLSNLRPSPRILRRLRSASHAYITDLAEGRERPLPEYARTYGVKPKRLLRYLSQHLRAAVDRATGPRINAALSKLLSDLCTQVHEEGSAMTVREKIELGTFLSKLKGKKFDKPGRKAPVPVSVEIRLPSSLEA